MNYFAYLVERTGGALIVNIELYAQILGLTTQTVYNQLSTNKFPFRRVHIGRKVGIRVEDLAHFMETGHVPTDASSKTGVDQVARKISAKRNPGRPPKYKQGTA